MRTLLFSLVISAAAAAWPLACHARTVVSKSTREPIAYASVGVINRNLGTLTDTLGNFALKIPAGYAGDSIRIAALGYKPMTFAVKDIPRIPDTIPLHDNAITLGDVVVKPQRIKHKTAGRRGAGGFIYIEVEGDKAAGQGIAVPLNVRKRAWIKETGFTILTDGAPLSHMKFRVNVYRRENGAYTPANVRPVYFDYDKSQLRDGSFAYRFPDEIMLEEGDYYVEIEFLENFQNEHFIMKSHPLTGRTRFRYASQSDWETLPFGAPVYIDYETVE